MKNRIIYVGIIIFIIWLCFFFLSSIRKIIIGQPNWLGANPPSPTSDSNPAEINNSQQINEVLTIGSEAATIK